MLIMYAVISQHTLFCVWCHNNYVGGLELEGVEVRVEINDRDKTDVKDLIPKQVSETYTV